MIFVTAVGKVKYVKYLRGVRKISQKNKLGRKKEVGKRS
jgi:hypothetical protein